ncbi:MAG: isoprenyl transferase [Kiritimatiellae bacterium]|nr:isoprenyl transferase [Kiritimatiellia bacterium]MDD3544803.1 isoprenyl transferase [Kiritimatiellia bacterium]MDD4025256.1 isoprenyl transferase [Kiritimatiellia bacterium]
MEASGNNVPRHIAMIMDGNGRWARQRGQPRLAGHEAGSETVRRVLNYCRDAGVRYLTLYAFSTENWTRPEDEVSGLMALLGRFIKRYEGDLIKRQVRLRVIGRRSDLSAQLRAALERVEQESAGFERQLIVALSYSGRSELVRAARLIAEKVKAGTMRPEDVDEAAVAAHLYAPDVPDPELIIRTSGEMRISNFLLWQCAYSEFYVTPVLWPDFNEQEFNAALAAYAARDRRFGGVRDKRGREDAS